MKLLVGLGNPGPRYAQNRHNIGFMALDAVQAAAKAAGGRCEWREKFSSLLAEASFGPHRALLLKPQTYMNESGISVRAAMTFYKIPLEDVFVFHDELDLPFARVRIKQGGGIAGHNGLRSISAHCGNEYWRIRLGIAHPGDKALVQAYVLGDFSKAEQPGVEALTARLARELPLLLAGQVEAYQSRVLMPD